MQQQAIQDIVIVGGGTSGWMTAAALSKIFDGKLRIQLVESDEISTVGVGEASIPQLRLFNHALGLDEDDFVARTQGTFKLGIEFVDWLRPGHRYLHAFGPLGRDLGLITFHQYWLKALTAGRADELGAYSLNTVASRQNRFLRTESGVPTNAPTVAHAFHFDAGLYARYLRQYSEARGVKRIEGKIVETLLREGGGFIDAVVMEDGTQIRGELFVDCSGFRGLLIEQALHAGYDDWTHWLPCDRAIAVPCESVKPLTPYTRATARPAGWQWRIPLQHRIGNGHVFSSRHMSEDEATSILLGNLDGRQLAEPRTLKFVTGKRKKFWIGNCVAIGLSSGFMEPLESTSIYLIQSGIARLMSLFPTAGFDPLQTDEYNRQSGLEFERVRDFIILHYKANQREDSAFWRYCREMPIPVELQRKIDLFERGGRVYRSSEELFAEGSWIQVLLGQGITPQAHHPLADLLTDDETAYFLASIKVVIEKTAATMPSHGDFITAHCSAAGRM